MSEEEIIESINITSIINKINMLSSEKNKNIFVENYNEVKSKINIIDKVLEKESSIDKNLSIDKLFEMLKEYNDIIENEEQDMDINEFKKMKDIIELVEIKLNNSGMDITEIK
jgi:hypothetical protein